MVTPANPDTPAPRETGGAETCEHHVGNPMAADLCGKVRPCPRHDAPASAPPAPTRREVADCSSMPNPGYKIADRLYLRVALDAARRLPPAGPEEG